jgi:cob(I)alamin adenosyltransferase
MAKKELTKQEQNDSVWAEIKKLEDEVEKLKKNLHPAELPKQASLNDCNVLARKAKTKPIKVDPKRVSAEKGKE